MKLFITQNPPIALNNIEKFEPTKELYLPKDYKAHLLEYNEATTESIYMYFGEPDNGINCFYFLPLKYGDSMHVEIINYLLKSHS